MLHWSWASKDFGHNRNTWKENLICEKFLIRNKIVTEDILVHFLDHEIETQLDLHDHLFFIWHFRGSWGLGEITSGSFSVHLEEFTSRMAPLTSEVPQGSNLGPVLFWRYMQETGNNIKFHFDADNKQMYLPLKNLAAKAQRNHCLDV